jgi:hypothetical protein
VNHIHFEHRHQKLASLPVFFRRWAFYIGAALLLILAALFLGVVGYHKWAGLSWIDALLNASMILGGMGPVNTLTTTPGKIFASAYALFSGLVFIAVMGIIFAPVIHRILHKFHVDENNL